MKGMIANQWANIGVECLQHTTNAILIYHIRDDVTVKNDALMLSHGSVMLLNPVGAGQQITM